MFDKPFMVDESFMAIEQSPRPGFTLFTTYLREGERTYSGRVLARDWAGAQLVCDLRGYGEVVDGKFEEDIPNG